MSKQYILICDEAGMESLSKTFKSETVQFLEVQGMIANGANNFNVLVTPIIPPLNPAVIPQAVEAAEELPLTQDANV